MSVVQLREVESGLPVQPSRAQWTWASPDAPIRINVALQMIARLRADLEQSSTPGEVGGVLLGYANQTLATLEILDYALLSPAPDSAGNYCLDVAQLDRLRRKRSELFVVGYFRTQSDGALHLRRPEVNLIAEQFHHSTDVALLIRTTPPQYRAGFLFWDGEAFVPFSVLDFPFEPASLAQEPLQTRIQQDRVDQNRLIEDPTVFPPVTDPATPLRTPVQFEAGTRKSFPIHRNMAAAGIGLAGILGLSVLFWNGLPWTSKPAATTESVKPPASIPAPVQAAIPPAVATRVPGPLTPTSISKVPVAIARPPVPPVVTTPAVAAARSATRPAAAEFPPIPPPPAPPAQPPAVAVSKDPEPANPVNAPVVTPPVVTSPVVASTPKEAAPAEAPKKEEIVATRPAPAPPVARPAGPAAPSRYAGGWSYPLNNGLYHGNQPEIVEVTIQESNGRLNGTAYARFKAPNERARTFRFQFSGPLRAGRSQAFSMETVDGAKGSIELIPGPSPNLLELNFQTTPENGNGESGNMILVKK